MYMELNKYTIVMFISIDEDDWNDGKFEGSLFTKDEGGIHWPILHPVYVGSCHHGYGVGLHDCNSCGCVWLVFR